MAYSADFGPLAIDDAHLSTLRYCCTTYGPASGVGNITGDPLFVDYAGGNLRLQPTSPCIDAGDIAYAPGPVDLDGNPRIVEDMVDMGAYEFQGPRTWPPVFGSQPASQTQDAGTSASFYVTVSGPGPFAFQWRKDGVPLLDGADIAGAATATLTLRDVLEADAGGYSVVVSNQYGSVTSAVALLTVNLATLDSGFNPGADSQVRSLALQADGKILVGGSFATLGGQARNCIGRLNADGTLDPAFNPGAGGVSPAAFSLAVQADGKVLVGGDFGGNGWGNIVRLNADGTLDSGFNPGASYYVYSLAVQADGKILVGGGFTTLGGQTRNYIGRLNADGTLDSAFEPAANSEVYSLAVQADGKILVGGLFTTLAGQTRNDVGRLNNTEPATQSLSFDGSTITWLRGGASPEVWRTAFDFSTNAVAWISLGAGARIGGLPAGQAGGWQLANTSLPSTTGTIRARGFVAGGGNNAWFVESTLSVGVPPSPPVILTRDGHFGLGSNGFGFSISAAASQTIVVETSTNLLNWAPLATNLMGSGPFYFSDPATGAFPARFYRARSGP